MAELTADLFISLDGFAQGVESGPYFGYAGPELEGWVRDQLDQRQLVLMGRVTYEAMAAHSMAATDEVSSRMNELPKAVVSNTLSEPLAWANTRLIRGEVAERVRALKRESADPIRSIGSITLVRNLLRLGLVTGSGSPSSPSCSGTPAANRIFLASLRPGWSWLAPPCSTQGS
jgi:dihydrofolate reductase